MSKTYDDSNTKSTKRKVLVAMSGRKASTVAAYLLKKQGYECYGVSLNLYYPNHKQHLLKFEDCPWVSSELALKQAGIDTPLYGKGHISNVKDVKNLCDLMEIPFYAVSAEEEYYYKVIDRVVSSKLSGSTFAPSIFCTETLFDILIKKADKLEVDYIATGHFAKLLSNHKTHDINVFVSNDEENDQSIELARLKQHHLSRIILPLSEMRTTEVNKIYDLLGYSYNENEFNMNDREYMADLRLSSLIKYNSPKNLREDGEIYNYESDIPIGEHEGVHSFHLGQKNLASGKNPGIDKDLMVVEIRPKFNVVVVARETNLHYTHCFLQDFRSPTIIDFSKPLSVAVKLCGVKEKVECSMRFKNNHMAILDFGVKMPGFLPPGEFVGIYDRVGISAKLLGGAIVSKAGYFDGDDFKTLPVIDPELENLKNKDELSYSHTTKLQDDSHHF